MKRIINIKHPSNGAKTKARERVDGLVKIGRASCRERVFRAV